MFAHLGRNILERAAPAHRALRSAAHADADVADLLQQDRARRYAGQAEFVRMIAGRGPLRDDITTDDATDVYWTLASPEVYALLTHGAGLDT